MTKTGLRIFVGLEFNENINNNVKSLEVIIAIIEEQETKWVNQRNYNEISNVFKFLNLYEITKTSSLAKKQFKLYADFVTRQRNYQWLYES